MKIKFQDSKSDYYKVIGLINRKSAGWRWYLAFILPLIIIAVGIFATINNYNPENSIKSGILFASLGVGFIVWQLAKPRFYMHGVLKKQLYLLEPSEINFSDEGIEIMRTSAKSFMEWSLVKSVHERPEFFAIVFTSGNFIPVMRKHVTEQEYQELKKMLQEKKGIAN